MSPQPHFKPSSKFVRACFSALALVLALFPISVQAIDKVPLPDQKDLMAQLQKPGGKDWTVTAAPDGYLMTYAQPVVIYSTNGVVSKAALAQQLSSKKTSSLQVKVIIGRALTAAELSKPNNPYSERPDLPMDPAAVKELNRNHFFICTPSSWAVGDTYAVYIASNESPDEAIYPGTASDAYDSILSDLGTLFHF